jgi:hypothetical protein
MEHPLLQACFLGDVALLATPLTGLEFLYQAIWELRNRDEPEEQACAAGADALAEAEAASAAGNACDSVPFQRLPGDENGETGFPRFFFAVFGFIPKH